jgi:hypothetical protein
MENAEFGLDIDKSIKADQEFPKEEQITTNRPAIEKLAGVLKLQKIIIDRSLELIVQIIKEENELRQILKQRSDTIKTWNEFIKKSRTL